MAQKKVEIQGIGEVTIQKRRANRSIKLSVSYDGIVKVTMPTWAPYKMGIEFAKSKAVWLSDQQQTKKRHVFVNGERIGKGHRISLIPEPRLDTKSRVTTQEIIVRYPSGFGIDHDQVQSKVHSSAVRALKQEANNLLPQRLSELARMNEFSYKSVSIKQLKSRWGSCSTHSDIVLSCYLMQLPWDLIDYVILHELAHTRVMAHGPKFWAELEPFVSNLTAKREQMRTHKPMLSPQS